MGIKDLNAINKKVCIKIMNETFPERINDYEESYKFDILSTLTVLNNYNIETYIEDIEEDNITDGEGDLGIDSLAIYINDLLIKDIENVEEISKSTKSSWEIKIFLIQSKFNSKWPTEILNKFTSYLPMFLWGKEINMNENLKLKQDILQKIWDKMTINSYVELNINICNIGNLNDIRDNKQFEDSKNALIKSLNNISYLKNIKINERDLDFILTNINKKPFSKKIKFIKIEKDSFSRTDNDGYIILSNIFDYYSFITENQEIIDSIFEENVRDYQSTSLVNSNIEISLKNDTNLDFWWLNNGITIIAEDIGSDINNYIEIKNPQIINGLQTSYSIHRYMNQIKEEERLKEQRKILIKIIKLNDEESAEKIIAASNTQNPMNYATLRANSPILKSLEHMFRAHDILLERRKSFYKNRNKDKNKIIPTDFLAKYYVAVEDRKPSVAKNRTIVFFRDTENFDNIFQDKNKTKILLITLLADKIVKNVKQIEINREELTNDEIKYIKIHFKYHIISMYYEKYKNEFNINNLTKIVNNMFDLISKYKNENNVESLRKLSTSIEFEKFMYNNLK